MKWMRTPNGVKQAWTTTAASQSTSTTAWWTSHMKESMKYISAIKGTNKHCCWTHAVMKGLHLHGANSAHWKIYLYLKKKETNPPTWPIWSSKYFSAVGAVVRVDLPVWSIILWLQPGINVPTSDVHWDFFSLFWSFHMFIESLNVTQHRIRNLFPPFMWLGAMERTEWMNNTHTHTHACTGTEERKWGLVTYYNTFYGLNFWSEHSEYLTAKTCRELRTKNLCLSVLLSDQHFWMWVRNRDYLLYFLDTLWLHFLCESWWACWQSQKCLIINSGVC